MKDPIPERLVIVPRKKEYGTGYIIEKGPQSYHVHYGAHGTKVNGRRSYYCACRTYEQAYYVKQELNKCGWNRDELPRILEEYPVWYTWLMNFWQYVAPREDGKGWIVTITPRCNPNNRLEKLYFTKVENALWERDLLLKYNFDENELTEAADDNLNPYFNMEIPPYPQRKIRRIVKREPKPELLSQMKELILEGKTQEEIATIVGHTGVTLRNILKREYNSSWSDFVKICRNGEDPNEVLEFQPLIYKPNLDYIHPNNNYVQLNTTKRKSHYTVVHKGEYFGAYLTRELANKISNDLQKVGWDKSQLKDIQAKHGHKSIVNSKRWIYETKYTSRKTGETRIISYHIRKKDKDRKIHNYGSYKDYDVACRIRDLLIENDWSKRELGNIIEQVKDEFGVEEI